jgi:hypothetical protein
MACRARTPGWFTSGRKTLDSGSAPRPPGTLSAEIRGDARSFRAEFRELRVRRRLGRELLEIERQVLADDDTGE